MRPLVELNPWFALPCLIYVVLIVFAALRIITAILVRSSVQVLARDAGAAVLERLRNCAELKQRLGGDGLSGDMSFTLK